MRYQATFTILKTSYHVAELWIYRVAQDFSMSLYVSSSLSAWHVVVTHRLFPVGHVKMKTLSS